MRKGLVWSLIFIIGVAVLSLGATVISGHTPLLGLDLKGGVSVVLQPQGTADNAELQEAVNIIENRVNGLGVSNSDVARQGHDVVINLPGIKNSQAALNALGETATLYFRPVYCQIPNYAAPTPISSATTVPRTATTTRPRRRQRRWRPDHQGPVGRRPGTRTARFHRIGASGSATATTLATATTSATTVAKATSPTTVAAAPRSAPTTAPTPTRPSWRARHRPRTPSRRR